MTRRALIVGIDFYKSIAPLTGAVNDAHSVKAMLERHADGSPNFDVRLITGTGPADIAERQELWDSINQLFVCDSGIEVALRATVISKQPVATCAPEIARWEMTECRLPKS